MKKIMALALLLSSVAFGAKNTKFICDLEKYPNQQMKFKISDLGEDNMALVPSNPNDEYSPAFKTSSQNREVKAIVGALNEQGISDFINLDDRIEYFGDAAGIDMVDFVLFKDSQYTKGFIRASLDGGQNRIYTTVKCQKN